MSSRSLDTLAPVFRPKAEAFVSAAHERGLDLLIYCTLRSREEQDQLYAEGRTRPGKIVTLARGGESAHNFGLAFDGAPLINGRIAWDDHPHWQLYGVVAAELGLDWGGNWPHFRELPHVQMPLWKDWR